MHVRQNLRGRQRDLREASAWVTDHAPIEDDLTVPQNPPDVYYIILDSYAREDFLKAVYDYDNLEFIKALQDRGFRQRAR